ncbi:MAG: RDD family protein [Actinomycetota bacterium]|nr:RDD family protein [Actinomycetota bacterium]
MVRQSGGVNWADDELDALAPDALLTGEAVALDLRPTSIVLSAAGAAIDFVVYLGTFILVLIVFVSIASQARSENAVYGIVTVLALVGCLVVAPAAVEILSRGKSLGRLAVGARIVRDDGGAIGVRHAVIRSITGLLEIFGTLGGLALIIGLLSPRGKRLGDLIAGTYSQYERVGKVPPPVFGMPLELGAWATIADVARMPGGLSRRIAQFLAQAPQLDPARRAAQATALAREAAAFVSPVPPVASELFLAGITVVRRGREAEALASASRRLQTLEPALRGVPHGFPDRG